MYDVLIVGGGPAGLAAALTLGRARRRALLCDGGPRRNAAATHLHNFVTRDGTPPDDFRAIGRAQLEPYPTVEVRDARVEAIEGSVGAFRARVDGETVTARRIILCTGMIDDRLPIPGFAALWGTAIFQCPFCHGWEVRDRRWGFLLRDAHGLAFAPMLRNWTSDVVVFVDPAVELTAEQIETLEAQDIELHFGAIERLVAQGDALARIELASGEAVPCDVLFAHPPQRQVPLVDALGLTLDEHGYLAVDPMTRETSTPGIYASGDLATRMQAAIAAATTGMQAAAMIVHGLPVG